MPAASFLGYLQAIIKAENEKFLQDLKKQSHLGWQIRNEIHAIMGGKPARYLDYLEQFDLLDENEKKMLVIIKEQQKQERKKEAADAMSLAEKIKAADQQQHKGE